MHQPGESNIIFSAGMTGESKKQNPPSPWLALVQLIVSLAIIFGLVYAFLLVWQASAPKEVNVPRVEGLDEKAALMLLQNAGLLAEISAYRPSETVPAGRVIEARPNAGRLVKQNRKVNLIISTGSKWTKVPDVRGISQRRAEDLIRKRFLNLGQVRLIFHAKLPKDFVVDQRPSLGTRVLKKTEVHLLVSRGQRERPAETNPENGSVEPPVIRLPEAPTVSGSGQ
jgi:serine/threonine-protein kinase